MHKAFGFEVIDRVWRVFATGLAFLVFGVGALDLGLLLGGYLLLARLSLAKRVEVVRGSIRFFCRLYLRTLKFLGLMSYDYQGFEHLDCRGKLIVANHPTLLDAVFLMALIPNATFVAKAAMTRHALTGGIARLAGYIANDEEGIDLSEHAVQSLQRGEALVIFPEGTRTSGGVPKFKRGAANIAIASRCPMVPVKITCEPITLQKNQKWYDIPPRKPRFGLCVLPEIVIESVIDTSRPSGIQARQLTQYLQNRLMQTEPVGKPAATMPLGV